MPRLPRSETPSSIGRNHSTAKVPHSGSWSIQISLLANGHQEQVEIRQGPATLNSSKPPSAFIEVLLGALTSSSHAGTLLVGRGSCARCRERGGLAAAEPVATEARRRSSPFSSIGGWATVSRLPVLDLAQRPSVRADVRRDIASPFPRPFPPGRRASRVLSGQEIGKTVVADFPSARISRGAAFSAQAGGPSSTRRASDGMFPPVGFAQGGPLDSARLRNDGWSSGTSPPAGRAGGVMMATRRALRLHGPFAPHPSRIARVPGDRPTASARRGSD